MQHTDIRRTDLDRPLTPDEVARDRDVRRDIAGEHDELVERHRRRKAASGRTTELTRTLQQTRVRRSLTIEQLAVATGVDADKLERLEAGELEQVSIDTLSTVAAELGLHLELVTS